MTKAIRMQILATGMLLAGPMAFAQNSGANVYKAECVHCHGATGMSDTAMGRATKVKPVTDPDVKKMSLPDMLEATRNGVGKMQGYKKDLTEEQIKASVLYFRSFIK